MHYGAFVPAGLADSSVKLERNKDKMYTLRITRKDEKVLRSKQGTFTVVETRKDGVKFTYVLCCITPPHAHICVHRGAS